MFFPSVYVIKNRTRIIAIRDSSPTAVETLARMFIDEQLVDDGTPRGRLFSILAATEHRFVPGLHTGVTIGLTGFRKEYEDPWKSSSDQVGHFLTAVRLTCDPGFLDNPLFPLLLGGWGDNDMAIRLMIGHEKFPDPRGIDKIGLSTLFAALSCFRAQYQSVTAVDIANFLAGNLEAIQVGSGIGNSMADLRLTYKGWQFGHQVEAGEFVDCAAIAGWVRRELGTDSSPQSHREHREEEERRFSET